VRDVDDAASAGGNNRRSSSASSISSGIGELRPATAARRTYSPTAVLPIPVASPTRRRLIGIACVRRSTSRIFLIDTLSAGSGHLLGCQEDRSADSTVDGGYLYAAITYCPQSPDCYPPCAGIGVRIAPDSPHHSKQRDNELVAGSGALTVPLTAGQWSSVFGKLGNRDASSLDEFRHAEKYVVQVGLVFGGGCFFGHGVNVSGGTAKFIMTNCASGRRRADQKGR